jgi:hypothetical protein
MKSLLSKIAVVVSLCATLAGCGSAGAPDVSGVEAKITARRFDLDFAKLDTTALAGSLASLSQQYPEFLNFYLDTLLGFGVRGNYTDSSTAIKQSVRVLLTNKDYRGVFDSVRVHFPPAKTAELTAQIEKGYRYYRHYFPSAPAQRPLIYFTSNLSRYSAITYDKLLGVGLDMYLGENYPFYSAVDIPQYMQRRLTPAYIPVDIFRSIYTDAHPFEMEGRTLLDMMVQRGQEQYFLQKVLPFEADSIRLGMTAAQIEWCEANQGDLFYYFANHKLLYETELLKTTRYVTDGPAVQGLPAEAPGNVGTFIGYKIFSAWMEKQGTLKMEDALKPQEAQKLLQDSGYKPGK